MELAALYNGNGRALQIVKDIFDSRICRDFADVRFYGW